MNYSSGITCLVSTFIREYDIKSSNISILLDKGLIDINEYNRISSMNKESRQVYIGKLSMYNPDVKAAINDTESYVNKLITENNIMNHEILSIKNDAIFIINNIPKNTKFGEVEFVNKNTYTSFIKLNKNVELYYFYDPITRESRIDVKGIGKNIIYHEEYLMLFFKEIFRYMEYGELTKALNYIKDVSNRYVAKVLPIGYYRQFNPNSLFMIRGSALIKDDLSTESEVKVISDRSGKVTIETILQDCDVDNRNGRYYASYEAHHLPEDSKEYIDGSYNLRIFRTLYGIINGIYFTRIK